MDQTTTSTTTPANPVAPKRFKKPLIIALISVVVVLLAPLVITSIMLYGTHTRNGFTDKMTEYLPFPAAIVNGDWLLYRDFVDDAQVAITLTERFADDPNFLAQAGSIPTPEETVQDEYDRLISVILLEQSFAQANLTLDPADIDAVYEAEVLSQVQGDETQLTKTLEESYGWTVAEFKDKVIRELILRNDLSNYLAEQQTPAYINPAKDKLVEIQAKITADPAAFAELAKQFSQDGSAAEGGDLGWFERGTMVEPFETAAFALTEPNQVSDIVQTSYGFHLIQLIEHKAATESEAEQVHARHILIQYSLDDYLSQQAEVGSVRRLIDPVMMLQ